MTWILATDVMPEEMEEVLLFDENNGLAVGYYFSETNSFIRHIDGLKLTNVLYWLPIPEVVALELKHSIKSVNTVKLINQNL